MSAANLHQMRTTWPAPLCPWWLAQRMPLRIARVAPLVDGADVLQPQLKRDWSPYLLDLPAERCQLGTVIAVATSCCRRSRHSFACWLARTHSHSHTLIRSCSLIQQSTRHGHWTHGDPVHGRPCVRHHLQQTQTKHERQRSLLPEIDSVRRAPRTSSEWVWESERLANAAPPPDVPIDSGSLGSYESKAPRQLRKRSLSDLEGEGSSDVAAHEAQLSLLRSAMAFVHAPDDGDTAIDDDDTSASVAPPLDLQAALGRVAHELCDLKVVAFNRLSPWERSRP